MNLNYRLNVNMNRTKKIEEIGYEEGSKLIRVSFKTLCIMQEMNDKQLIDKFEIMRMLTHKNILKAYDIIINDKNLPPSILFENCPTNLNVEVKNKKFTKVQQVFTIVQIAEGMKYIHSRNVAHQNLIPSKILISGNGTIKISGLEKCQLMKSSQQRSEIELKMMEDVYSFGNIVYFILTDGEIAKIKNETVLEPLPLLAKQLIYACWSSKPEIRPTFEIICDVLEKNTFNLISFSKQEINEISQMINQYKAQF